MISSQWISPVPESRTWYNLCMGTPLPPILGVSAYANPNAGPQAARLFWQHRGFDSLNPSCARARRPWQLPLLTAMKA